MAHRKTSPALFALAALLATAGAAQAIDRAPFPSGGFVGDARPNHGSTRSGYGAERQYSGAETTPSARGYAGRFRASGSFLHFDDYAHQSRAGIYPGFGGGSFVDLNDRFDTDPAPRSYETRAADGAKVEIIFAGGAKLIRIAAQPADGIREAAPERAGDGSLEPWSEAWQRYCSRAHPDFDSERGTFTASNGATRFCTGE